MIIDNNLSKTLYKVWKVYQLEGVITLGGFILDNIDRLWLVTTNLYLLFSIEFSFSIFAAFS